MVTKRKPKGVKCFEDEVNEKRKKKAFVKNQKTIGKGRMNFFAAFFLVSIALAYLFFVPHKMPTEDDLRGKTIVITGTSSGIGKALSTEYSKYSTNLIFTARREELLKETEKQCTLNGATSVHKMAADLSRKEEVDKFVAFTKEKAKRGVDILVLNHAIDLMRLTVSVNASQVVEEAHKVMDINFFSFVHLARALYDVMNRGGRIVVVSSQVGNRGIPFLAAYSASKHALHGWFVAFREELKLIEKDISVTILVHPFVLSFFDIKLFYILFFQAIGSDSDGTVQRKRGRHRCSTTT